MGSGSWSSKDYDSYLTSARGLSAKDITSHNVQSFYTSSKLDPSLNPYEVKVRECRDTEEHPNTIPVILALDVTGSMGSACAAVARQLDSIMTKLYEDIPDVEFMVMGIGDFAFDQAPLQVSQFESDVRVCEHLSKIWFEQGGGGNSYESYSAAWYFALNHVDLDCWKRGQKGIIITMGDEPLNPYLPGAEMERVFGHNSQDIETVPLYKEVTEKFDVYHIVIMDREGCGHSYYHRDMESWGKVLDNQHLFAKESSELPTLIHDIVASATGFDTNESINFISNSENIDEGVSW